MSKYVLKVGDVVLSQPIPREEVDERLEELKDIYPNATYVSVDEVNVKPPSITEETWGVNESVGEGADGGNKR